jgi:peptide/nickel transport system substrate-binding protein
MVRLIPQPGKPIDANELGTVNDLIQARIDGRISRRALMRRAAALGISSAVIGVMLHATSDMAFGAPSGGRAVKMARLQDGEPVPVEGPTAPEGTPIEGGTIITGGVDEPDTLHPYLTQLAISWDVFSAVCESFLVYDNEQVLQPVLASEFSISEDGLAYTFVLRPGARWHNGEEFGPQDVIDTWTTVMDPEFGAYSTLGWDMVTSVEPSEDGTSVVIITSEVYAPFISYVGAAYPIVPSSEIAKGFDSFKQEYGRRPIGTGPMSVVEWRSQEQIELTRFDDYWGEPTTLDRAIYRVLPDDNTQLVQLRTGEIQVSAASQALNALRIDEALTIEGITILEHPSLAWKHLDLKHVDHLRQTKVRQALDFATPKQQIIEQLLKNRVVPGTADQAPGTWAYNPDLEPRPYDPDMARQLLEEAGLTFADGVWSGPTPTPEKDIDPNTDLNGPVKPLEIELWAPSGDSQNELIVQIVAQAWNEIGVRTAPKFEDVSTIWSPEGYQFTEVMTACLYSWFNSNEPDDMFYWHSDYIPATPDGAGGNTPAYFFPFNFQAEIDDLTYRATQMPDQEERAELYRQIQALLAEEVPVIFIYWDKSFPAVTNNLGGFLPSAFTNLFWNVNQWYLTQ